MVRFDALKDSLRSSLWFLPLLFAAGAVVLALALVVVDRRLSGDPSAPFFMSARTAEGARSVLSTIAQSMLTFTALVFTITMLVLQLASSQLSPRVMRTFLRDRGNQIVLGLFVATFVFTLLVLREVRTPVDGDAGFVPSLSVWVAFMLLLASVGAFIYYIDHMAQAIRASTVIANIWEETVVAIDRLFPERIGAEGGAESEGVEDRGSPDLVLTAPSAGYVMTIDEAKLFEAVGRGDRLLELVPSIGGFVPEEAPLARLWGDWDRASMDKARDAIGLGKERTLDQDAAFGFRQLVDIATRALSPGTNDPTTAVHALDRIHDLLRRLALRRFPSPLRSDEDGIVRLVLPRRGWDDYVRLGLDEIRLSGEGQIQITLRLRTILEDLADIAIENRVPVIREELALLDAGVA